MKNISKHNLQQGQPGKLPVHCEVLLACLTGSGGRALLPDFHRIWGEMLPESAAALPEIPAPRQHKSTAARGDVATPAPDFQHAHTREGPD